MTASLEYLAGILDSTGQMLIIEANKSRNASPIVEVRRSEPELLNALAQALGGRVVWYEKRRWFYWKLVGKKAQAALRMVRPYLIVKARQADRLLLVDCNRRGGTAVPVKGSISQDLAGIMHVQGTRRQGAAPHHRGPRA